MTKMQVRLLLVSAVSLAMLLSAQSALRCEKAFSQVFSVIGHVIMTMNFWRLP